MVCLNVPRTPPHSQANLRNAILERAVFTRSDLGGANVEGADFTNALLDKTQQMVRANTNSVLPGLRGLEGTWAVLWFGVWREQQASCCQHRVVAGLCGMFLMAAGLHTHRRTGCALLPPLLPYAAAARAGAVQVC